MAEVSGIGWTKSTFNPWIGCEKVSPACKNCYAETERATLAIQATKGLRLWGPGSDRYVTSNDNWRNPVRWNKEAAKTGEFWPVFCASLADVFEDRRDLDAPRARLFKLIEETPHLTWLLLTKRVDRVRGLVPNHWHEKLPPNVWIGMTAENQATYYERILWLAQIPAVVRFVSAEPLLSYIDLGLDAFLPAPHSEIRMSERVHWVIAGGENGPRKSHAMWFQQLRDQCKEAGVKFFFKQTGTVLAREMDLKEVTGSDPDEWPEEFRVQERPAPTTVTITVKAQGILL